MHQKSYPGETPAGKPDFTEHRSAECAYPTYKELENRISFDFNKSGKSTQALSNLKSTLHGWMRYHGAAGSSPSLEFAEEHFQGKLGAYLNHLNATRYSDLTIRDRQRMLRHTATLAKALFLGDNLPSRFDEALKALIHLHGMTLGELAKRIADGGSLKRAYASLSNWTRGCGSPTSATLPLVKKIEGVFGLRQGALLSKTLSVYGKYGDRKSGRTTYARKQSARANQRTRIIAGEALQREWSDFIEYKTTAFLEGDLRRNKVWRLKAPAKSGMRRDWASMHHGEICASANFYWNRTSTYLGYLALPAELGGKGIPAEKISLALLSDASLIKGYLEWQKQRSGGYNRATLALLNFCSSVLQPGYGYLKQKPEFAQRLPEAIPAEEWDAWCERNLSELVKRKKALVEGKHLTQTRDPGEPIRAILSRQKPIQALIELVERMREFEPPHTNPMLRAIYFRDRVLIKLMTCNPLRVGHYAIMTYRPDQSGNLYRTPDGTWHLRFTSADFKNHRGAAKADYDVAISDWVAEDIQQYLSQYRPLLEGADSTDFVFLPSGTLKSKDDRRIGPEFSWNTEKLSERIFLWSQRCLPNCPGFGAHALRHIVATDYLKNHPQGYQIVAHILHDKLETVLEVYGHVKVGEGFSHYTGYLDSLVA